MRFSSKREMIINDVSFPKHNDKDKGHAMMASHNEMDIEGE